MTPLSGRTLAWFSLTFAKKGIRDHIRGQGSWQQREPSRSTVGGVHRGVVRNEDRADRRRPSVDMLLTSISEHARSGAVGDARSVTAVESLMRVRTGETCDAAV